MRYEVIVGNIGCIPCASREVADETYDTYVGKSKRGEGRAAGEDVTMMKDGEPVNGKEHIGELSCQ